MNAYHPPVLINQIRHAKIYKALTNVYVRWDFLWMKKIRHVLVCIKVVVINE